MSKEKKLFRQLKEGWIKTGKNGASMQLRLFCFFTLLVVTVVLGVLAVLFATGIFSAGSRETKTILQGEITHLSQNAAEQFGNLSIQSVALSQEISNSMEAYIKTLGLTPEEIAHNPEALEALLGSQFDRMTGALESVKSSGVFLILDATINPEAENAENSRAGLFIKNMEPNILNASAPNILMIRGPVAIARENGYNIHSQWKMEFDTEGADYYTLPMQAARETKLQLSRLYYWCPNVRLPETNETIMLCSVPLIASDGTVFGVCGFEVSEMLFKLANMPDNSTYTRIFCMISPVEGNRLNTQNALLAGNYSALPHDGAARELLARPGEDSFDRFEWDGETLYAGMYTPLQMYPRGSAFENCGWAFSLMMPEQDLLEVVSLQRNYLILFLLLLMAGGVAAVLLVSKKVLRPMMDALETLKTKGPSGLTKTHILEIDDFIAFLSAQDDASKQPGEKTTPQQHGFSKYEEFVKNIETLSPAERAVFNLYMKGYTAKEIAEILCLSINTIKTHNKRIYMKLNVTSRKELMVYVDMMAESRGMPRREEK
ncbi:MAG: helix-turn-helix transcriptional regulator [Christensenella sp.]|nr:helix-turn-helix transcriptional regulator [Christensenella sp.]